MKDEVVLGVIPARGGSKRISRKNIKLLGNKPLVAWTIEAAKKAKSLDYFLVSTGDEEIAQVSRDYGAPVPFKRPKELRSDCDTSEVVNHAMQWFEKEKKQKVSHVVTLQPTSPLRTSEDIDICVNIAKTTGVDTVISVAQARQHPAWMLEQKPFSHELQPFIGDVHLEGDTLISQNLPFVWYPNGAVYATKREWILKNRLFGEKWMGYTMPIERSLDLEEELDFIICSAVLKMMEENEGVWHKTTWLVE